MFISKEGREIQNIGAYIWDMALALDNAIWTRFARYFPTEEVAQGGCMGGFRMV